MTYLNILLHPGEIFGHLWSPVLRSGLWVLLPGAYHGDVQTAAGSADASRQRRALRQPPAAGCAGAGDDRQPGGLLSSMDWEIMGNHGKSEI